MPIRRIEGATPAPVIDVNGKKVTLWNHGTTADGVNLTVKTIRPICEAINGGFDDLSAALETEKSRAIQAETDLSGWCDSLSSKLDTVSSNLDIVSGDLIDEIERSTTKDNDLQDQIDTLKAATDVIMVYNTYSDFSTKSGSLILTDNDVIKVLNDEERQENQTYYQYSTSTSAWSFIGELDPYYSKTDLENAAGKNINITTANGIKINTNDNVNFDSVSASTAYGSSAKFTNISATNISANLFKSDLGTVDTNNLKFISAIGDKFTTNEANVIQLTAGTLYGQSNNSNVDSLIGSAQSGKFAWNVINSAKFSAVGTTTSTAYLSGGFAIKAGDNLTLTYADKTITLNAGDTGITAISAGNTKYTGPVFSASAGTGINFVNDSNNVLGIKASNSLITSAKAGSAASAWVNNTLFDYSYYEGSEPETAKGSIDKIEVLYKNDVDSHDKILNQEVVFSRGNYSVSGLLIQAAKNTDDGKVLTYNTAYNNYTWQPIPPSTYSNDDDYISIDNANRKINLSTTGIKTSAYSATYDSAGNIYDSYLNGQTLHFSYGHGGLDISFTGVSYYGGGSQGSTKWDNLFLNYAQVNRDRLSTANLTADKVNFIVATGSSGTQPYKVINFVVTSTLPAALEDNTYYIV